MGDVSWYHENTCVNVCCISPVLHRPSNILKAAWVYFRHAATFRKYWTYAMSGTQIFPSATIPSNPDAPSMVVMTQMSRFVGINQLEYLEPLMQMRVSRAQKVRVRLLSPSKRCLTCSGDTCAETEHEVSMFTPFRVTSDRQISDAADMQLRFHSVIPSFRPS